MTSNRNLYEIRSDDAWRQFRTGYATMYAAGQCENQDEYRKMMDRAFVNLERAHAIEPENPHIVYWMAWWKDFSKVPADEIIPTLELTLDLCKSPVYRHTDHIVDLVTYALNEYRKRQTLEVSKHD